MSHSIPQELIDATIDYLFDDLETLARCALVCHGWLDASRTHFFHKVSLEPIDFHRGDDIRHAHNNARCARLYQIITVKNSKLPSIIPYIHSLVLEEGDGNMYDVTPRFSWFNKEQTLPLLLPLLTSLKRFSATGALFSYIWWEKSSLRRGVQSVLQMRGLTHFALTRWAFPDGETLNDLLLHGLTIKHLHLEKIYFASREERQVEATSETMHSPRLILDSLVIREFKDGGPRWMFSNQCALDLRRLPKLQLSEFEDDLPRVDGGTLSTLPPLITHCASSLQELDLLLSELLLPKFGLPEAIHKCINLRTLRLQMTYWKMKDINESIFSNMPLWLPIEAIEITYGLHCVAEVPVVEDKIDWLVHLDEMLTRPGFLPCLKRLGLEVVIDVNSAETPNIILWLETKIHERSVPRLKERGVEMRVSRVTNQARQMHVRAPVSF